jgi:hypothetical protein
MCLTTPDSSKTYVTLPDNRPSVFGTPYMVQCGRKLLLLNHYLRRRPCLLLSRPGSKGNEPMGCADQVYRVPPYGLTRRVWRCLEKLALFTPRRLSS